MKQDTMDLETLRQHIDANTIIINLLLAEMAQSSPEALQRVLYQLSTAIDTTPQLHPTLRKQLEARYSHFARLIGM